jgi:hypothetical protein
MNSFRLVLFAVCALTNQALAQNATTAGAISTPFPTINNLTVEWAISGDANNNGVVAVRYRAAGSSDWRNALPLRRVPAGSNLNFAWANRHSGSIFNVSADTNYEVELALSDPDGGSETRTTTVRTRVLPIVPANGNVRAVSPATLAAALNTANPGDIIELSAGSYGAFTVPRDGVLGNPITIRGTNGAVVQGELGLFFRSHVFITNLTINGRIRFNGSNFVSITNCTINAQTANQGDGIVTLLRAENSYIADNTITGTTSWAEASLGVSGSNLGEGILVAGPGHVVARNIVRGFRDNLSLLEDINADQHSIDFIDNELSVAGDDGIEADFCIHNCRILRNRMTNVFIAMSAQPSFGGPTYFIRNSAYNVIHIPFKLYRSSVGDVILHNTIVKNGDGFNAYPGVPIARSYVRNNLFLGGAGGTYAGFSSGSGRVIDLQSLDTSNSSLNYNGYGTTLASFQGRIGSISFNSLAQLRTLTSETNAQQVSFDVFQSALAYPEPGTPFVVYAAPDLRIRADSIAANTGEVLPNVNDGFSGLAPDLGAFEATDSSLIFHSGFENLVSAQ